MGRPSGSKNKVSSKFVKKVKEAREAKKVDAEPVEASVTPVIVKKPETKEPKSFNKLNCEICSHPLNKHRSNGCQYACTCTRKP